MPAVPESIGKYRVIRPLGEGGMGAVFVAHDDGIDRDVAIKLLRGQDEDLRRRFQTEAQSAGRLRHSNIVTIHEFGEYQGEPFLVMEFIEGNTVASLISSSMDVRNRLGLLIQLCRGLAYAHRSSVVHRDIKPTNLMVDKEGVAKIVDFGIARSGSRDLTMTGKVIGTPAYMAPEQIQGEAADHRSDIFSMGLVVFEFLSGQCAYTGDSDFAIINRIVNGSPNPFTYPSATLMPVLQPVVERAIAKDPAMRFQSADHLADELERVRTIIDSGQHHGELSDASVTVVLPAGVEDSAERKRSLTPIFVAAAVIVAGIAGAGLWTRARTPDPLTPPVSTPAAPVAEPVSAKADEPKAAADVPVATAPVAPPPPASEKPQRAEPTTTARTQTQSSNVGPALAAARAAMTAGDYDAAVSAFSQVLAVDPGNSQATEGLSEARRNIDRARSAALKGRLADAEQKLSDGAYDEAISIFEGILKTDATNPDALDGASRARRAKAAEDAIIRTRAKKPSGSE